MVRIVSEFTVGISVSEPRAKLQLCKGLTRIRSTLAGNYPCPDTLHYKTAFFVGYVSRVDRRGQLNVPGCEA